MTRYFLEHWVFAYHNRGLPEARERLGLRILLRSWRERRIHR